MMAATRHHHAPGVAPGHPGGVDGAFLTLIHYPLTVFTKYMRTRPWPQHGIATIQDPEQEQGAEDSPWCIITSRSSANASLRPRRRHVGCAAEAEISRAAVGRDEHACRNPISSDKKNTKQTNKHKKWGGVRNTPDIFSFQQRKLSDRFMSRSP